METLSGTVERITFHSEDTGYSVMKVTVGTRADAITVTGDLRHATGPVAVIRHEA